MPRRAHGEGSIYRRRDGRWVAAVRLPNGRRRYRYTKTQGEAVRARREHHQDNEAQYTPGRQTVDGFSREWLEHEALEIRRPTQVIYERLLWL